LKFAYKILLSLPKFIETKSLPKSQNNFLRAFEVSFAGFSPVNAIVIQKLLIIGT